MAGKVPPRMRRRAHGLRGLQQHAKEREPGAESERKQAPMIVKPDVRPDVRGRVATRDEVIGFRSREFHPADWIDPNPEHCWYICDPAIPEDAETIERNKQLLAGGMTHWYVGGELVFEGPISYDPVLRPVLFIIGNVR